MSIERDQDFEQLEDIAAMMAENPGIEFENGNYVYYGLDGRTAFAAVYIGGAWAGWQAAKAQAVPEGFVLVPKGLTYEQAVKISDDENFFETYQTILTESDTSEDSAVILIQTAHKAMIEAQEPK